MEIATRDYEIENLWGFFAHASDVGLHVTQSGALVVADAGHVEIDLGDGDWFRVRDPGEHDEVNAEIEAHALFDLADLSQEMADIAADRAQTHEVGL